MTDPTARTLRLLGLLQARPVWTGPELAARTGVTSRTVRRDVDRLRELGYPVRAAPGAAGGDWLGAGRALPPLLLDDEEAVAVAVCLVLGSTSTVEGLGEPALRTLSKLDQVLPARLREQVRTLSEAMATLPAPVSPVQTNALMTLARAVRARVRVRFAYTAADGAASERDVEPLRLVSTGARWYLPCWDVDRADWRTFRLDRMTQVRASTFAFRPRPGPDPVEIVRRALAEPRYRHMARVVLRAPLDRVRERVPASIGRSTDLGGRTRLTVSADDLDHLARHLVWVALDLDAPLSVEEPPELGRRLASLPGRLADLLGDAPA